MSRKIVRISAEEARLRRAFRDLQEQGLVGGLIERPAPVIQEIIVGRVRKKRRRKKQEAASLPPAGPKMYLNGWREILGALELSNDKEKREWVRNLNDSEKTSGPILSPGRGVPPKVEKSKLLAWWNSLEKIWEASNQRMNDRQATVTGSHEYGRRGDVIPDIAGSTKKRRQT
jgi:hypothetical protein